VGLLAVNLLVFFYLLRIVMGRRKPQNEEISN